MPLKFSRIAAGFLLLWQFTSAQAGECSDTNASADIAQCLGKELRESDAYINRSYKELMGKLDDTAKSRLRQEQRQWLKERDAVCRLDSKESDREKWFQWLLLDYRRTVCVTRYTRQRTAELNALLAAPTTPAPAAPPQQPVSNAPADYRSFSRTTHENGRWYLEIFIDTAGIAKTSPTALWIGCDDEVSHASFGQLAQIRGSDGSVPSARIGIALDLDNGRIYIQTNGNWNGSAPGSSGGMDLKLGRPYRCGVESTVLIGPLLGKKYLEINSGEKAFTYSMPDGYRPFQEGAR